ncbi:MAG TPA: hypothetical protein VK642_03815 [Burkholderiales bacterium]|nr:hypothetical protein [Burkholderiales bacterium]
MNVQMADGYKTADFDCIDTQGHDDALEAFTNALPALEYAYAQMLSELNVMQEALDEIGECVIY